ncbi:MAG TPA: IS1634 family transposase [Waddliaceae bacterium]
MFVRTKTTPNSPRKSIQIVENSRDPKTGKVKQKILRYVGIAMDDSEEEKLKQLALEFMTKMQMKAYAQSSQLSFSHPTENETKEGIEKKKAGRKNKKRIEDVLPVDQVTLDMIIEESRIIDGVHEVAGHIYDQVNYNQVLRNNKYSHILKDLVLCRISNPSSKLATSKALNRYYMKEHDLDTIYRTMDHVFEKIDKIQRITFHATASLIPQEVELVLFDVTTLHFESTQIDELRRFGYSKNFRFNTTQVVLALATTSEGLPIGYELFEGNKAEVKTLIEAIDSWKEKFNIKKVCFIGDRAMFSEPNLKALESRGYQYIIAAKLRALPKIMHDKIMDAHNYSTAMIENDFGWVGSFIYDEKDITILQERGVKPSSIKKYQECIENHKNRKFVVSYVGERASYDRKKRGILLEKIEKQLDKSNNSAKLISNSALKKFTSSQGKSNTYIDHEKIQEDEMWDGFHGVITNISDDAVTLSNILSQYRKLVKIEDCFRVNKSTLKMRPIYHFKPERIRAHVAICYMAFAVIRQLEYRVKLVKKISLPSIIEELNSVQSSIYVHKVTKDRYRVPGNFSNEARKIYQAINLKRELDAQPLL